MQVYLDIVRRILAQGVRKQNRTGVSALSSGSTVRIANLAILNNSTGINVGAGATVASFGGNKNAGNTTPGARNRYF